jgi:hypothetical protein
MRAHLDTLKQLTAAEGRDLSALTVLGLRLCWPPTLRMK